MNDVTLLIPWGGDQEDLLWKAIRCFPKGTPFVVAKSDGKFEMAAALNDALGSIETTWVLRMDADDLVPDGYLDLMLAGAGSADGAYPTLQSFGALTHANRAEQFSRHRLCDDNNIPGPILVRTAALKGVGGWRPHPMEDWDLAYRLAAAGYRLEPVAEAIYQYRRYVGQTNDRVAACLEDGDFTWNDLRSAISGEKRSWPACFYTSTAAGVAYVRGSLMAEYMPAPVRETYSPDAHNYKAGVWHHINHGAGDAPDHDRSLGRAVVVDVDDNYLSDALISNMRKASRWVPAYAELAAKWEAYQPSHRRMTAEADLVVCSTPALADVYREVNERVVVVRNAVEPLHWTSRDSEGGQCPGVAPREPAPPRSNCSVPALREAPSGASRRIRVGWAAAQQHGPDAEIAMPALRWAASQPDVEVVCVGLDPDFDFPYTHYPMTPSLQAYRDVLSTFDIGIAPLKRGGINRWKSDLKWLEYAAAGAATVATRLDPYDSIDHGRTGLLADDRDELAHHVAMLVGDEARRHAIASAAQRYVFAERTSEQAGEQYLAALQTLDREAVAA